MLGALHEGEERRPAERRLRAHHVQEVRGRRLQLHPVAAHQEIQRLASCAVRFIWSCTSVGLTSIWMFLLLAQMLSPFSQIPVNVSPSKISLTAEH